MKKRLFSLLLSVLLVLALIPGAAFAADTGLYFTVTDGEAALTETSWKLSGDVTIPAAYQGAPVTSIADDAFEARREVTSVTVPEGVKTIGSRAFGRAFRSRARSFRWARRPSPAATGSLRSRCPRASRAWSPRPSMAAPRSRAPRFRPR